MYEFLMWVLYISVALIVVAALFICTIEAFSKGFEDGDL